MGNAAMLATAIPVVQLGEGQRDLLREHFAALPLEDVRRRFGVTLDPQGRDAYVDRINFQQDCVFAVFADDLSLAGVAHLAHGQGVAEVGLSILPAYRRQGIGKALFQRAMTRARNLQAVELFVHCLAENDVMLHIAREAGMRIVMEQSEADAYLELPPATVDTLGADFAAQQTGLIDYTLKAQAGLARCLTEGLVNSFAGAMNGARPPPARGGVRAA